MTQILDDHEGCPVRQALIRLKTPGSALNNTMSVSPHQWRAGEEVFLVLKTRVGTVAFPEHEKGDPSEFDREHYLDVTLATVVDKDLVDEVLIRQQQAIDESKGIQSLDFDDPEGVRPDGLTDDEWMEQAGLSNLEDDTGD